MVVYFEAESQEGGVSSRRMVSSISPRRVYRQFLQSGGVVSSGRMVSSFGWCREVMSDVLEVLDGKSGIRQGRDCRMELVSYEREKHGVRVWVQLEREKNKSWENRRSSFPNELSSLGITAFENPSQSFKPNIEYLFALAPLASLQRQKNSHSYP